MAGGRLVLSGWVEVIAGGVSGPSEEAAATWVSDLAPSVRQTRGHFTPACASVPMMSSRSPPKSLGRRRSPTLSLQTSLASTRGRRNGQLWQPRVHRLRGEGARDRGCLREHLFSWYVRPHPPPGGMHPARPPPEARE